jgi:hypothetical protein
MSTKCLVHVPISSSLIHHLFPFGWETNCVGETLIKSKHHMTQQMISHLKHVRQKLNLQIQRTNHRYYIVSLIHATVRVSLCHGKSLKLACRGILTEIGSMTSRSPLQYRCFIKFWQSGRRLILSPYIQKRKTLGRGRGILKELFFKIGLSRAFSSKRFK